MHSHAIQKAFLIDDSDVDLFILKKFIEMSHFAGQVVTFNSPTRALDVLTNTSFEEAPGVIFLDLNMPILSGFDFLEKVKLISSGIANRIKVVILTSSSSSFDKDRAKKFSNVISFLSKPLTVKDLDTLVLDLSKDAA